MARIARIVVEEEEAVYHVMLRTALDGFMLLNISGGGSHLNSEKHIKSQKKFHAKVLRSL